MCNWECMAACPKADLLVELGDFDKYFCWPYSGVINALMEPLGYIFGS